MPKATSTKADTPTKAAAKELKAAKALKKQQKEDKPKIKRAPSPYIVFCTEKRPEAKDANPDATFGMLGKILGGMWSQLDEAGKAVCRVTFLTYELTESDTFIFLIFLTAVRESLRRQKDRSWECLMSPSSDPKHSHTQYIINSYNFAFLLDCL